MELDESIKRKISVFEQLGEQLRMSQIEIMSKKLSVSKEELLCEIRKYEKDKKYGKQKDKMKFFHSTDFSSANKIIRDQELLSAKEREKRGEIISNARANTRAHGVQFTHDYYNSDGNLTSSGYKEGHGASGSDITFVFGEDLYNDPLLDTFEQYPSIDYVSLDKCLAIICSDDNEKEFIVELLKIQGIMNIIVFTQNEFDVTITASELKNKSELNKMFNSKSDNENNANMTK